MKKNFMPIAAILLTSLFFAGCDWQIPQKVSVKTDATYELGLGDDFIKRLADDGALAHLNLVDSIEGGLGEGYDVYDYFPGKKDENLKQILIGKSVHKFSIPGSNLRSMDSNEKSDSLAVAAAFSNTQDVLEIPLTGGSPVEPIDLGFNMSNILKEAFSSIEGDFDEKLKFRSVPIYVFAKIPNTGSESDWAQAEINGAISIFYQENGVPCSGYDFILGNGNKQTGKVSEYDDLGFAKIPDLKTEKITEGEGENEKTVDVLTQNFENNLSGTKTVKANLAAALNTPTDAGANLFMSVDLQKIKLPKSLFSNVASFPEIELYMYIDFQMNFLLEKDAHMVLLKGGSSESEEGDDSGGFSNPMIDTLEGGYITLVPKQLPFIVEPASATGALEIVLDCGTPEDIKIQIKKIGEPTTFHISSQQLGGMITMSSGGMGISLAFPKGIVKIPRQMSFDADLIVGLKTGGEIEVYPNLMGGAL